MQLDDPARKRSLQTEIWYPANAASAGVTPLNKFSDFLSRGVVKGSIAEAEGARARVHLRFLRP
jgi:hypothetical protein